MTRMGVRPPGARPPRPVPAVSVVMATYRRPKLLERCLEALLAQTLDAPYEIVVVDDGRDEATRALVERIAHRAHGRPHVRYLLPALTRGPAAARNVGWRSAVATVIAFTDDDTIPSPQWLAEGLAALSQGAAAATGRVQVPVSAQPTDYERNIKHLETAEFVTANCFVRRAALERVGGFDERFLRAWREDSDLHFSLLEHGATVVRAPRAVVVHPVRPAPWGVSLRTQSNVFFDALLYAKHRALYRRRIRRRPPLDYHAIVLCAFAALAFALAGRAVPMAIAGTAWFALTTRFAIRRLRGTRPDAGHRLEMVVTSALIPFLAVFWRIAGGVRFRTLFL